MQVYDERTNGDALADAEAWRGAIFGSGAGGGEPGGAHTGSGVAIGA